MKNPTAIASFECEDSAGRVARKLRYAGFDARVRSEFHPGSGSEDLSPIPSIYRVIVPAMQTARALSWCREFDAAESLLSQALRCPHCGSTRVTAHVRIEPAATDPAKASRIFRCHACFSSWKGTTFEAPADHPAAA